MVFERVKLNWRAYYREFEALHGGAPIKFEGRLLFRDGWRYSSTDYAGPEEPPPTEPWELKRLRLAYWRAHRSALVNQANEMRRQLNLLISLQENKSAPLQLSNTYVDMETNQRTTKPAPVDFPILREQLTFVEQDIAMCDTNIEELSDDA